MKRKLKPVGPPTNIKIQRYKLVESNWTLFIGAMVFIGIFTVLFS